MPSVENAKRIADVLDVSLDYLVSEEEKQEAIDNNMLKRIQELQKLSGADQNNIISVIDAFVRDAKTKQAYS